MADSPYKGDDVRPEFREVYKLKAIHDAGSCHTYRAIVDIRIEKAFNPKNLPNHIMSALISAARCPNCLGHLDAGMECKECEFWAQPWLDNSRALNDAAFDRREG